MGKNDGPDVVEHVHELERNLQNRKVCEQIIEDIAYLIEPFPDSYDNAQLLSLRDFNKMNDGLRVPMMQMSLDRYYSRRRVVQRK
jgi:hypothetical protein